MMFEFWYLVTILFDIAYAVMLFYYRASWLTVVDLLFLGVLWLVAVRSIFRSTGAIVFLVLVVILGVKILIGQAVLPV